MEKIILSEINSVGSLIDFLKSDFKVSDLSDIQIRYIGSKIVSFLYKTNQFDSFPVVASYIKNVPPCQPFRYIIKGSVYRFSHPDSVFKFLINVSCHEKTEEFFDGFDDDTFIVGNFISRETRL